LTSKQPASGKCRLKTFQAAARKLPFLQRSAGLRPGAFRSDASPVVGLTALDFRDAVIQISLTMKTATVRDLRNRFPRVAAWISEGEPVEITRAGKLFARLVPATPENLRKLVKPDIMAQLKETWGDRVFSAKEVAEMRAAELEGEEG
jgi:antitoxin (DNA-binding transcriptional repressor) of toxin-antitoxin stability system